jgi:predicted ATPase
MGGQEISFPQPPLIPASVEEATKNLDPRWPDWQGKVVEGLGVWLRQLALAESVASVRSAAREKYPVQLRIKLRDQEPRDITEIGFGLSQILPVLTAGLMQPQGSLLVVDLPEAHLHPWPQARLADFFCSMALSGRFALVETHSEMFFHRLRLWAALNQSLVEKIAVYFVDEPHGGECSQPREIGLSSGEQIRWPSGFLGEAWDTEKRIGIIREARSVRA